MPTTTVSSREFNQDTSRAKKAAKLGPVFITDRGQPAHVLLSIDEYRKLTGGQMTLSKRWRSRTFPILILPRRVQANFSGRRICLDVCSRHQRCFRASPS